ncbi:hypothetical protein ABMA27_007370 [Loxostege sticticalis]|uniref:Uncharacterized protein n=1 Tax=Loxostege sticticalis TaxID=481309 RepID=A0ABR3HF89_LOXSC
MSSLVPLKLVCDNNVLWENKQPSSTMFSRPLFLKFSKENSLNIKEETENILTEYKKLNPSYLKEGVSVTHHLLMTMVDGKIISKSETSNQVCDICKAKPTDMNHLTKLKQRSLNIDMYKYGLSSLHAWIRAMETILHIAYRLEFKTWTARGNKKAILEKRKAEIQKRFRDETGLLIDIVQQGAGTTNNGNAARRFFADPEKTSNITGVSQDLIARLSVLLRALASGEQINPQNFTQYGWETAELFVSLYGWYYMPSSMHKLLIHGGDIIKHLDIMPIGALSEEAAESRNKDFRKIRENRTRKFNRKVTNRDILNNLLISSDPFLPTIRPKMSVSPKSPLPNEVKNLLASNVDETFEFIDVDDDVE